MLLQQLFYQAAHVTLKSLQISAVVNDIIRKAPLFFFIHLRLYSLAYRLFFAPVTRTHTSDTLLFTGGDQNHSFHLGVALRLV